MRKIIQLRNLYFLLFIVGCTGLPSCKVMNPSTMFQTDNDFQYTNFEQEKSEYIIRPFDKLNLRIYTNDGIQLIDMGSSSTSLTNQKVISPYMVEHDGLVKVPTLGRIKISGLTIKEAEKELEEKYSQYYQKPFVLVNITNRRVIVFNSGSNSGQVLNIENEKFTLIEALAQAGGIDDFSKAYKIKLLRGDLDNPKVYLFNISNIEEIKKANMVLQANDIIYVEKRARYASKTLNELMPYVAIFNTLLLLYVTVQAL
ncbi:MAG: polysaccharide biosynthesis/export family protein [Salinivirgaceae bacterium]|nr:polysaccharide biosynthesis/export family protein [Salinivirgaceae bacterium]